jgi:hypothetical protein
MGSPYFRIVVEIKVSAPSSICKTLSSRPVNMVKNAMGSSRVKAGLDLKNNRMDVTFRNLVVRSFKTPLLYPRPYLAWVENWTYSVLRKKELSS